MVDLHKLRSAFARLSKAEPRLFSAPGRVNLIGEHTDYNEGFVLPMAANLRTTVAAAARDDGQVRVHSLDLNEVATFSLTDSRTDRRPQHNGVQYIKGVAYVLAESDAALKGADLAIASEVPIGAGMSSSAALEVSVGFALSKISGLQISKLDLARAAQKAEHDFVGTNSGLMDQLTAAFAETNHAMLIDCRSFELKQIPMELFDSAVVVCDTRVKHTLASSAYNQRRAECESAVALLAQTKSGITALRDFKIDDLDLIDELPEPERSRARHVVTENDRTQKAAQALEARQAEKLGELMVKSHQSLRDDFAVSCRELDIMVELALRQPGVYGARMMGGGFGGCTINLVHRETLKEFEAIMMRDYEQATGFAPFMYVVQADEGVRELS